MTGRTPSRVTGLTLIEFAMVALLAGLIAAIALPAGTNTTVVKIDSAASEVAAAIRYARDESIRTGVVHGLGGQNGPDRLRVFRMDGFGTLTYDVYHPVSKQLWDIQFDASPHFRNLSVARSYVWRGVCNDDGNIAFRVDGTPVCTDPDTTLLEQAVLSLQFENVMRDVLVDGFTGRVWLQ